MSKPANKSLTLAAAMSLVIGGGSYLPMGHCVSGDEREDDGGKSKEKSKDILTDKDRAAIAKAKERQLRRQLRRDAQRELN